MILWNIGDHLIQYQEKHFLKTFNFTFSIGLPEATSLQKWVHYKYFLCYPHWDFLIIVNFRELLSISQFHDTISITIGLIGF